MIGKIEAVVFDCDGVLVDTEPVNNQVFAALVSRAGIPTTAQESVARYMGRSTAECLAEVEQQLGRPVPFDLAAEYEAGVLELLRDGLAPIPGVEGLLRRITEAGIAVCVASSANPSEIAQRLRATGLDGFFGGRCYSASMVRRGKPAPDLFLFAAREIGVHPGRCVVIEDSPYGVQGAKAAGMAVIGYAALAGADALRAAGADHVVTDMAKVMALPVFAHRLPGPASPSGGDPCTSDSSATRTRQTGGPTPTP